MMRVAFMGTPLFAVPSLRALFEAGHEIAGVFTQPDRPSGRGHRLVAPPVKELALELGVPVYQLERIRRQEGIDALRAVRPQIVVTAAFGQILSRVLLAVPPLGTVNVHASLLPKYRGPAPVNWCIINGEKETGVTTMYTDAGVDTGDMIYSGKTEIGPEETAGELTERLALLGAELVVRTLADIEAGRAPRIPQDHGEATRHPMLTKETGRVDWSASAQAVDCLVRGVAPWPGATTTLEGEIIKLWKVKKADGGGAPGSVLCADPQKGFVVACGDGAVEIVSMQAAGKSKMDARDYLRGHPVKIGMMMGDRA